MPTTLVATPEPLATPPRVLLQLEYTGQTEATITRLDPDGTTRVVRLGDPATLTADTWTGYDYESYFGEPTTYTATTGAGSVTSSPVTLAATGIWLRHPGVPDLSVLLDYQGDGDPVRAANRAVLHPLGRRTPIVVSDGRRKLKSGVMRARTETPEQEAALLAILDDLSVLLLDIPPSLGYGVTHEYRSFGDLTESRFRPDYYPHPWRYWQAPFDVVGRPAGGLQAQRTWGDVVAQTATWADLIGSYGTWTDVLTGSQS